MHEFDYDADLDDELELELGTGVGFDLGRSLSGGFPVDGGEGVCRACGCTEDDPCPGGCIWATPDADLCSRCARER
jgi:hypothetical protein